MPASWSGVAGPPAGVIPRRGLFGLLSSSGRVAVVSAPAGSGKTFLLRSWIAESGLAGRAARVAVQGEERATRSGSGCRCSPRCGRRRPGGSWSGR